MNDPKIKKHARDLMSITGMKYQAARRAVTDERQRQASIDSGFGFRDFVTPRELRTWLLVNHPEGLDCHRGRHFYPTEMLGQCVGCGVYIEVRYDGNGDEYEQVIDEDRFLERCENVEMYYGWAPPMSQLGGQTQAEYRTQAGTGGGRGVVAGDGWPIAPRDSVVGAAISEVRGFVGNSLPEAFTAAICEDLSLAPASAPSEVMVSSVWAAPKDFPYLESALAHEYDYGLELHEVGVGFDADLELTGLPSSAAAKVVQGAGGRIVYDDGEWATVALDGVELSISAQVRYEFESTEIVEYAVALRDE
jgi:hypothetical protein